jgi:CRP-like cAMP-binding protein
VPSLDAPASLKCEEIQVMNLVEAKSVLVNFGWLARQSKAFQDDVLQASSLLRFASGDVIYRCGDPIGGVYGLVAGAVVVSLGPPAVAPRVFHLGTPGSWIGEGPFLSREPRRVGMQAAVETWMMHFPLEAMDYMASKDPLVWRRFVQILLINLDILVRAFCDIQNPNEERRIALALRRIAPVQNQTIPLSQTELGLMAHASRKQVNAALHKFESQGWIKKGYRSVTIEKLQALIQFGEDVDSSRE